MRIDHSKRSVRGAVPDSAMLIEIILVSLVTFCCADEIAQPVGITYLTHAKSSGAVCLDGTVPAYHLRPGGRSWHISLEGGGWCESEEACAARAKNRLGSSTYMLPNATFHGLLNNDVGVNPDFYNWTHVFVRYCDGASFSADVDEPVTLSNGQVLYLRGKRILKAVVDDLKSKGLNQAKQVLLSGCSAGGLAVTQHCNEFQGFFTEGLKVKCLSDGGFFLNASDATGSYTMSKYYSNVAKFHKLKSTLDRSCIATKEASECFFPQTMEAYVQPQLFLLNAAYDLWQIENVLRLPLDQYSSCLNFSSSLCPAVNILQSFRKKMISALSDALSRSSVSMFINSCFTHCQASRDGSWNIPKINGRSIAQTVGDWYFERDTQPLHAVDCEYPCNPTCSRAE